MKKILISLFFGVMFIYASVDINHANIKELTNLHGIGEVKAQRIINYIKLNGCFKKIDDLDDVKGIGKITISKNQDTIEIKPCKED